MKIIYIVLVAIALVAVGAIAFYYPFMQTEDASIEQLCTKSGGTVTTQLCCNSASNFPNTCLIGACGCSPENSHSVKVCSCGDGKCWNGTSCN